MDHYCSSIKGNTLSICYYTPEGYIALALHEGKCNKCDIRFFTLNTILSQQFDSVNNAQAVCTVSKGCTGGGYSIQLLH